MARPKTPRDLTAHECIRVRLPSGAVFPWRFRIKGRTVDVHVQGRLIVNDVNPRSARRIEGTGLLQLPHQYVASELAARRLSTVLDRWAPPPVDGFFLYYPSRRQIRPALKVFVDFLRRRERA